MLDPLASFQVKNIIPISIMGFDLSITNSSLFMIAVVVMICALFAVGTSDKGLIPRKTQVIIEKLFFFAGGIVKSNIDQKRVISTFPYIISLFLFIMFGNLIGLFPFAFSFTSQLIVTLGLALLVFISSIILGFINQGKGYLKHFCPDGIPVYLIPFFVIIEIMSFLFRPISLGIRLFANMVAGHIMIKVIASFAVSLIGLKFFSVLSVLPIVVNVLLNIFKLVVCMLQAYVFAVLSCIYLAESFKDDSSKGH